MNRGGRKLRVFEPLESRVIPAASLLADFIAAIPTWDSEQFESVSYAAVEEGSEVQSAVTAQDVLAVLEEAPRTEVASEPSGENTDPQIREYVLQQLTRFAMENQLEMDESYRELVDIVLKQIGDGSLDLRMETNE